MTSFTHIAKPLQIGRVRLKNRIVHAAILTRFAENERATERLIAYHVNRARGGAAMIITEAVNALPMQAGRSHYLNAHLDTVAGPALVQCGRAGGALSTDGVWIGSLAS